MTASAIPTETPRCPFGRCAADRNAAEMGRGWDFEYATTREESRIVSCQSCGLWHLAAVPSAEAMETIYPRDYYAFSESGSEHPLVKRVRDRLERAKLGRYLAHLPEGPARVLDVGCGDGRLLDLFRRHGPADWTLEGLEIGGEAARRARAKGYSVREGDFESVDTEDWDERFDLVLLHQVIEHLREPRRAAMSIARLLRPGGVVSIETPDTNAWDARLFRRRYWGGYHIPRHFYLFDRTSLARLVREAGLEVLSQRPLPSPVFWVHSLHNALVDHPRLARLARFAHYQNPLLLTLATAIDAFQIALAGTSSNQQLLARRP